MFICQAFIIDARAIQRIFNVKSFFWINQAKISESTSQCRKEISPKRWKSTISSYVNFNYLIAL